MDHAPDAANTVIEVTVNAHIKKPMIWFLIFGIIVFIIIYLVNIHDANIDLYELL